uniref:Uncharacterized protein n=1 Tax=Anguilla anguilla TaxID=7936 RepID=A0A0E9QTS7_ANGAN
MCLFLFEVTHPVQQLRCSDNTRWLKKQASEQEQLAPF